MAMTYTVVEIVSWKDKGKEVEGARQARGSHGSSEAPHESPLCDSLVACALTAIQYIYCVP